MEAYRVKTIVTEDGSLTLVDLPFLAGETVQVTIVAHQATAVAPDRYSLRGTSVHYVDPTEPIADDEWESAR